MGDGRERLEDDVEVSGMPVVDGAVVGGAVDDDGDGVGDGALDDLLEGLGAAFVDLLDAVHDRVAELGPAQPAVIAGIAEGLRPRWAATPIEQRPLLVLDSLRAAVRPHH